MHDEDLDLFAELLLERHAAMADNIAFRRAQHFNRIGDLRNCSTWLAIRKRVQTLQYTRHPPQGSAMALE